GNSSKNRIFHKIIPSERGVIYDRNSNILAENTAKFEVITSLSALPQDKRERDKILLNLANDLGISPFQFFDALDGVKDYTEPILLVDDIPYDKAIKLMSQENKYPFIQLETTYKRKYITDRIPSLSHILGYTGIISADEYEVNSGYRRFDQIGKQGLEAEYESELRGIYGEESIEVDAKGNLKRIISRHEPIDGQDLTLALDINLQSYIETILKEKLEQYNLNNASVVVMDPNNGDVLALVSWPAFDANDFSGGIDSKKYNQLLNDERKPLFPRVYAGEFPSGSTIKPVHAAAALMDGVITTSTSFLSTGGIRIGIWFFPDWKSGGHGLTNVYWAIADSVNTFFYIIGGGYKDFQGLGIDKMMSYDSLFGFGKKTGIDLPGEADGFLPSPKWKMETKNERWYIGDTYHVAIGQGDLLVTPLQITVATSVFANNGYLVRPRLNLNREIKKTKIVDEEITKIIRDAMRLTVTAGSAQMLQDLPVEVAGKTGTAQWSTKYPPHSWFTGFAPVENPSLVITVLIENGGNDYLAVPITRDILNWYFSEYKPLTN
ncbi:penicillin-binding protein 2, partial [Candidatus Parcubacteria bacterium]